MDLAGVIEPVTVVVNAGSTSVKISRFAGDRSIPTPDRLEELLRERPPPDAVLHRVVHGGQRSRPVVIDDGVAGELAALADLAPLHQPPALDAIRQTRAGWPDAVHVACFDTSFHVTGPPESRTYALPHRLRARVRGYGFHGLSFAWAAGQVATVFPDARRLLVAHLGGGQSLCGVLDGASVVTTMGFTPLDGLVMATRCGSLDPGAVLWLQSHTDEELGEVLERKSGLLGLCGASDMRDVVRRADSGDAQAEFALRVWQHRFVREAGGCIAALGGLDVLVFTGGIGEHAPYVRRLAADGLGWLGVVTTDSPVREDPDRSAGVREITAPGARVRTLVVPAREDLQMLAESRPLLDSSAPRYR